MSCPPSTHRSRRGSSRNPCRRGTAVASARAEPRRTARRRRTASSPDRSSNGTGSRPGRGSPREPDQARDDEQAIGIARIDRDLEGAARRPLQLLPAPALIRGLEHARPRPRVGTQRIDGIGCELETGTPQARDVPPSAAAVLAAARRVSVASPDEREPGLERRELDRLERTAEGPARGLPFLSGSARRNRHGEERRRHEGGRTERDEGTRERENERTLVIPGICWEGWRSSPASPKGPAPRVGRCVAPGTENLRTSYRDRCAALRFTRAPFLEMDRIPHGAGLTAIPPRRSTRCPGRA